MVNTKQAQATAERDDYWKRREQIYQPSDRRIQVYGSAYRRAGGFKVLITLLNETEKQQPAPHHRHTLSSQIRHEGLCIDEEGDKREHKAILNSILTLIFRRIRSTNEDKLHSKLARQRDRVDRLHIPLPISIRNIESIQHSICGPRSKRKLEIKESIIKNILWETTCFKSGLNVTHH